MALVAMLAMVSASSGCSDDGVDYSVTIVAKTTLSLSKNAGTGRLAYEIQGADKSSIVEATTNVDWIKNFNYAEPVLNSPKLRKHNKLKINHNRLHINV